MSLLNEGFEEIFGTKFDIEFRTPANAPKKSKPSAAASITTSAATAPLLQSPDSSSYEYTFDTFIVGSSNKFAHAACLAVATNPSHAYNPLFLYGNSGLGKTHLLYAIGNEIKKNDPSKVICYIKGDDFTVELVLFQLFKLHLQLPHGKRLRTVVRAGLLGLAETELLTPLHSGDNAIYVVQLLARNLLVEIRQRVGFLNIAV